MTTIHNFPPRYVLVLIKSSLYTLTFHSSISTFSNTTSHHDPYFQWSPSLRLNIAPHILILLPYISIYIKSSVLKLLNAYPFSAFIIPQILKHKHIVSFFIRHAVFLYRLMPMSAYSSFLSPQRSNKACKGNTTGVKNKYSLAQCNVSRPIVALVTKS